MKRPNKNEYLKYGINAGITLEQYDIYIDHLESQLKELTVKNTLLARINNGVNEGLKYEIEELESQLKESESEIRSLNTAINGMQIEMDNLKN